MQNVQKYNEVGSKPSVTMTDGRRIYLGEMISSGKQANVYLGYDAQQKKYIAVKHLFGKFCDPNMKSVYYDKCCLFTEMESPHEDIVWIYSISRPDERWNFMYAMPLVEGHEPISLMIKDVMCSPTPKQYTMKTRLETCQKLAAVFGELHRKKCTFGDISDSNVLFDIKNGKPDVKVIDSDNILTDHFNMGMQGTGSFRAPEVICGDIPTISSDRHSLAVLTFRILCGGHPLYCEAQSQKGFFTTERFKEQFGTSPVFRFDGSRSQSKSDSRDYTAERWGELSTGLKRFYKEMFSQDCLRGISERPTDEAFEKLIKSILKNY